MIYLLIIHAMLLVEARLGVAGPVRTGLRSSLYPTVAGPVMGPYTGAQGSAQLRSKTRSGLAKSSAGLHSHSSVKGSGRGKFRAPTFVGTSLQCRHYYVQT